MARPLIVVLVILVASLPVLCDDHEGYWAGEKNVLETQYATIYGNELIYPRGSALLSTSAGVGGYLASICRSRPAWEWKSPHLTYAFVNTASHVWTSAERAVVEYAMNEWTLASKHAFTFSPASSTTTASLVLLWKGAEFFSDHGNLHTTTGKALSAALSKAVAMWVPDYCAFEVNNDYEMGAAFVASGLLDRAEAIVFNVGRTFYVDPDPTTDDEWDVESVLACGQYPRVVGSPNSSHPMYGVSGYWWDLGTVAAHELGHALGLLHTGGCDGDGLTVSCDCSNCTCPQDCGDWDGSLMWGGELAGTGAGANPYQTMLAGMRSQSHVENAIAPCAIRADAFALAYNTGWEHREYREEPWPAFVTPADPWACVEYMRTDLRIYLGSNEVTDRMRAAADAILAYMDQATEGQLQALARDYAAVYRDALEDSRTWWGDRWDDEWYWDCSG